MIMFMLCLSAILFRQVKNHRTDAYALTYTSRMHMRVCMCLFCLSFLEIWRRNDVHGNAHFEIRLFLWMMASDSKESRPSQLANEHNDVQHDGIDLANLQDDNRRQHTAEEATCLALPCPVHLVSERLGWCEAQPLCLHAPTLGALPPPLPSFFFFFLGSAPGWGCAPGGATPLWPAPPPSPPVGAAAPT